MIWEPEVKLTVAISDEATVAVLVMTNGQGEVKEFVGTAKRHPKDETNVTIGCSYATGRAFEKAVEWLTNDADRLVDEANERKGFDWNFDWNLSSFEATRERNKT